jgi:hypothetical protein
MRVEKQYVMSVTSKDQYKKDANSSPENEEKCYTEIDCAIKQKHFNYVLLVVKNMEGDLEYTKLTQNMSFQTVCVS